MDEILYARMCDLARAALKRGDARFSRFLDPAQWVCAERAAREVGVQLSFFGGYDEAERTVAAFYSADSDAPTDADFPIVILEAVWDARYGAASHRDMLGAQMALGLNRACLGDIALGEACAYLFVLDEAASYVEQNLTSAGRTRLKIRSVETVGALIEPEGRKRHVTVQSMRLDAVVAGIYDVSRAEAQRLIARELVKLNHLVQTRSDAHVQARDLISVRGQGRSRVLDEAQLTRKGRLAMGVFIYGG